MKPETTTGEVLVGRTYLTIHAIHDVTIGVTRKRSANKGTPRSCRERVSLKGICVLKSSGGSYIAKSLSRVAFSSIAILWLDGRRSAAMDVMTCVGTFLPCRQAPDRGASSVSTKLEMPLQQPAVDPIFAKINKRAAFPTLLATDVEKSCGETGECQSGSCWTTTIWYRCDVMHIVPRSGRSMTISRSGDVTHVERQ
jgi:hypothetical protein